MAMWCRSFWKFSSRGMTPLPRRTAAKWKIMKATMPTINIFSVTSVDMNECAMVKRCDEIVSLNSVWCRGDHNLSSNGWSALHGQLILWMETNPRYEWHPISWCDVHWARTWGHSNCVGFREKSDCDIRSERRLNNSHLKSARVSYWAQIPSSQHNRIKSKIASTDKMTLVLISGNCLGTFN